MAPRERTWFKVAGWSWQQRHQPCCLFVPTQPCCWLSAVMTGSAMYREVRLVEGSFLAGFKARSLAWLTGRGSSYRQRLSLLMLCRESDCCKVGGARSSSEQQDGEKVCRSCQRGSPVKVDPPTHFTKRDKTIIEARKGEGEKSVGEQAVDCRSGPKKAAVCTTSSTHRRHSEGRRERSLKSGAVKRSNHPAGDRDSRRQQRLMRGPTRQVKRAAA